MSSVMLNASIPDRKLSSISNHSQCHMIQDEEELIMIVTQEAAYDPPLPLTVRVVGEMTAGRDTLVKFKSKYKATTNMAALNMVDDLIAHWSVLVGYTEELSRFHDIYLSGSKYWSQANGYHTCVLLVERLSKKISSSHISPDWDADLLAVLKVLNFMLRELVLLKNKAIRGIRSKINAGSEVINEAMLLETSPREKEAIMEVFLDRAHTDHLAEFLVGEYNNFWLCPSLKRVMIGLSYIITTMAPGLDFTQRLSSMWDASTRGTQLIQMIHYPGGDLELFRWLWNMEENDMMRSLCRGDLLNLPFSLFSIEPAPMVNKDLAIPVQKMWNICVENGRALIRANLTSTEQDKNNNEKSIRCRLLMNRQGQELTGNPKKSVLLHAHGGGWISQSPDLHQRYINSWSNELPNLPLILVDYSLSPEAKYPTAVQQVLDTYLWLISENNQKNVECELGFVPEEVIMVGDSAGAMLIMECVMAIQECNLLARRMNLQPIPLPVSIVGIYPTFQLAHHIYPSRFLLLIDVVLPSGLDLTETYLGKEADTLLVQPMVSPLEASEEMLHELRLIELHLIVCHFDPLLDESVGMVSRWRGPTSLTVLDEMNHGHLTFYNLSPEARLGNGRIIDKLKSLLAK